MRSGVVLQGVDAPATYEAMVDEIEALGFDVLWCTDSSLHARDPYVYLALAARRTTRLRLGTAVTNPRTRHPAVTAVSASTVDELAGGRLILGIGAGDRPLHALGYRPASRARLRTAIEWIRELLAGKTVDAEHDDLRLVQAHLRYQTRPELPVFISASGPKTLELAGEVADGVIVLSGLFEDGIRYAVEHIERGAERAGRERPHVGLFAYGAIDEDEDAALRAARSIAAWFPQTAPHYCDLAGLAPDLIEAVRARYRGGEFQEADEVAAMLPEAFVRRMALSGNRARVHDQLEAAFAAGVDSVSVFPLGDDRMQTVREFARAVRGDL